jgi:hypothetical protein
MAEAVLNFGKVLEALFGTISRDNMRTELRRLGYTREEVEHRFIACMALRNEISVGHVSLAVYSSEQIAILQAYTAKAEGNFRELLERVSDRLEGGSYKLPPTGHLAVDKTKQKVIERIAAALERVSVDQDGSVRQVELAANGETPPYRDSKDFGR